MFGQPDPTKLRILGGSLWAGTRDPLPPAGLPECPDYLDDTDLEPAKGFHHAWAQYLLLKNEHFLRASV
jgi:hypothetical protein